jgi:putative resolvase
MLSRESNKPTLTDNLAKESFLSPAQASEILHVHPQTLKRYEKEDLLTTSRTSGGHRRYQRSEIEKLSIH